MAQAALGGCLPLAGCRVAVTLMCTALAGNFAKVVYYDLNSLGVGPNYMRTHVIV